MAPSAILPTPGKAKAKNPLIVVYGVDSSIGKTGYANSAKTLSEIRNAAVDYIAGPISQTHGSSSNDFGPKEAVSLFSGKLFHT